MTTTWHILFSSSALRDLKVTIVSAFVVNRNLGNKVFIKTWLQIPKCSSRVLSDFVISSGVMAQTRPIWAAVSCWRDLTLSGHVATNSTWLYRLKLSNVTPCGVDSLEAQGTLLSSTNLLEFKSHPETESGVSALSMWPSADSFSVRTYNRPLSAERMCTLLRNRLLPSFSPVFSCVFRI